MKKLILMDNNNHINDHTSSSARVAHFMDFSIEVCKHIEEYANKQYGDFPNDQLTKWTVEDVKKTLQRYVNRIGTNARGQVEAERDCKKIAHYAQVLNYLLTDKFSELMEDYNDRQG